MEQEKCSFCKGEGGFSFTLPDGTERNTKCRCGGTGLEIDNVRSKSRIKDIQIRQIHEEHKTFTRMGTKK